MSEIVYIILAHQNPLQVKRLVGKLKTSRSYFYIHVDLKSDIDEYLSVMHDDRVVFLTRRISCIWGDFSIVQATLNLIEEVMRHHRSGHCVLLSGQDYPVKPVSRIEDFLHKNRDKNFISIKKIEEVWTERECERRTKYYRINQSGKKGDYLILNPGDKKAFKMVFNRTISFRDYLRLFHTRKINLPLYGGSQWWAFNFETLKKIHAYIESNRKKLFRYFRHTNCADEIFFHTIIKHLARSDKTIFLEDAITYANWQPQNSFSPEILTKEDFYLLARQPPHILFARKFDVQEDSAILDLIDNHLTV